MRSQLRRLNEVGLEQFRQFLNEQRAGHATALPHDVLSGEETSEKVSHEIELSDLEFSTRYELGKYLVDKLKKLNQQEMSHDVGLWSWVALFYFDQLAPLKNGKRSLRENYTYILSAEYNHQPRHSVRTTYLFVRDYDEKVAFMFSKKPYERGEIVEQLAARQELASCRGVIHSAHALYDDPDRMTFKRGAASKGKGSIRRFISVLQQFNLTYDINSLTAHRLLTMLPKEFDRFKASDRS